MWVGWWGGGVKLIVVLVGEEDIRDGLRKWGGWGRRRVIMKGG